MTSKSFFKQELKEYRELSAKHKLYLWLKVGTLAVCVALWVLGYWIPALIASVFVAFDLYGIYTAYKAHRLLKRHGLEGVKRI